MRMKYQAQELSLANGITLSFTASVKDNLLVYNAFSYRTEDPSEITHTFRNDLSREELIALIFNLADEDSSVHLLIPEFLEPVLDEEFDFSFPSSIELEEQPYLESCDIITDSGKFLGE